MANTIPARRAGESAILRLDTAEDNVIQGLIKIQCIIFEPSAAADTVTIENSLEEAKIILVAPEEGTAANQPLANIVIPFPLGFRIQGISIGAISSGARVTIVLE